MTSIDLNADLGELPSALADGTQEQLLRLITSANIACGGHAGDAELMRATLAQCRKHGVAAGAHPSYPDRANFGRSPVEISATALAESIAEQVQTLLDIASELGVALTHVKPHGALYNQAAQQPEIAWAMVRGLEAHRGLILYALRGSPTLPILEEADFRVAREVFADRAYQPDGTLRPRHLPGALLTDPKAAAANALGLANDADTLCLHSDTPGAVAIAHAVREALLKNGFTLAHL